MRIFALLAACLIICPTYSSAIAQEPLIEQARKWELANGEPSSTAAVMLSADQNGAVFRIPQSTSTFRDVPIPWNKLAANVKREAQVAWLNREDQEEFAKIRNHLIEFEELPSSKTDTFKVFFGLPSSNPWAVGSKSFSPYAGLWAAVGLAAGKNNPENARLILSQVIQRIDNQRKLDGTRHSMTLCSAYNNMGIVQLKLLNGDAAAGYFSKAIEVSNQVPAVVRHNALQLSEYVSEGGKLRLGEGQRKRLLTSMATAELQGDQANLPPGWLYSLDFNIPNDAFASPSVDGIDAPVAGMELVGIGSGVVITPGMVVSSRTIFDSAKLSGRPVMVTVCEPDPKESGKFKTVHATKMYASLNGVYSSTYRYRSPGGLSRRFTEYTHVSARPGEPSGEMVALLTPGLRVKPAVISDERPHVGDTITLLSYRRGPDLLEKGLQTKVGTVQEQQNVSSAKAHVGIDIRVEGGDRGGAIMDGLGTVCGIAFDYGTQSGGGKFFEIESLRRWIDIHVPIAQLEEVDLSKVQNQDLEPRTRGSVVPVLIWSPRDEANSSIFSQVADSARASGGIYIREPWCLQCSGNGFISCPNCNRGLVSKKVPTVVGTNPITGAKIVRNRVERTKCSACSGNGGFKCPHCQQGKLPPPSSR